MRIEQEIFDFYEKLSLKEIIKNQQYKSSYNYQYISILIFYLLFIASDTCLILGAFFPLLKNNSNIFLIGVIIFLMLAYTMTRKTKDFNFRIIRSNGEKVDINDIKEEQISNYLIERKHVIENKDNSLFYSDIIQVIQFYSTYLHNKSISIQSMPIIGLLATILSSLLNQLNNKNLAILVIFISKLISLMFIALNLQSKFRIDNKQSKYNELYLILLDLKMKDSLHNKPITNTETEHLKFILY